MSFANSETCPSRSTWMHPSTRRPRAGRGPIPRRAQPLFRLRSHRSQRSGRRRHVGVAPRRLECPWEAPVNLGPQHHFTSGDGSPGVLPDGHLLFFSSARDGGEGNDDIWVSHRADPNDDLGWGQPLTSARTDTMAGEVSPSYIPALGAGRESLFLSRERCLRGAGDARRRGTGPAEAVAGTRRRPGRHVRKDGREAISGPQHSAGSERRIWVIYPRSPNDEWSAPENVARDQHAFCRLDTHVVPGRPHTDLLRAAAARRARLTGYWMTTRTSSGRDAP